MKRNEKLGHKRSQNNAVEISLKSTEVEKLVKNEVWCPKVLI
jgi:hypothetical protein